MATIMQEVPRLDRGRLQVWRFFIDGALVEDVGALSFEELQRADRMRRGVARDEFLLGRVALRHLLGCVTGRAAGEIELAFGEHGKPVLVDGVGIDFSMAHSRGLVVIALSADGVVGIDVEFRDAAVEIEEIAATSFHPEEEAEIHQAATEEARLMTFYRCWTRKEAALKADGRGLLDSLNIFSVAPCGVHYGSPGMELEVRLPGEYPLWVRDLELETRFAGAVACGKPGLRVDLFDGDALPSC